MVHPSGFREYDGRWRYPAQINLAGVAALGRGIGTQVIESGLPPDIVVGCDFRSYSPSVKNALMIGLIESGIRVKDIGIVLSPIAYFGRVYLSVDAVAMVTASHNPNGWTGVKIGLKHPLTHGESEMARLRQLVLGGVSERREGGGYERVAGVPQAYIEDLCAGFSMTRRLKAVCATGNGTASMFAPKVLERIGVEVIPLHTEPDFNFPHFNPNPESLEMLRDMAAKVAVENADIALGFDGDGDRLGVVDDAGNEIFSDKLGVLLARDIARKFPGAIFVTDIKSTGIYKTDPELARLGATTDYWKTGHSHMKRRVAEIGAMAGFEKSGHFYFSSEIGHGYDCGLRAAVEVCKLLENNLGNSLSQLAESLPSTWSTPTMSPHCPDEEKYAAVERITQLLESKRVRGGKLGGQEIVEILNVSGARALLANGSWALVRASSNTPNLVVVCESTESEREMREIFEDLDLLVRSESCVGDYDQRI